MLVLGLLGATFASLVTQHQYAAVHETSSVQALYLAEAGFEMVILELLDNHDYAFNGAPADGVIGTITNVPIGAGTVSVTKGTQTPPVFTATGTVGDVSRVITMTIDVKNLVTLDPVFSDPTNLPTNWPEAVPTNPNGASGIATDPANATNTALKTWTTPGKNQSFTSYREQVLAQSISPNSSVIVRLSHMRDRTGAGSTVNKQTLSLQLVNSDGSTNTVWSEGPSSVSDTNRGIWFSEDLRGVATSATLSTTKARLFYDLGTSGSAATTDQAFGWFDNIQVNLVKKSAWGEP